MKKINFTSPKSQSRSPKKSPSRSSPKSPLRVEPEYTKYVPSLKNRDEIYYGVKNTSTLYDTHFTDGILFLLEQLLEGVRDNITNLTRTKNFIHGEVVSPWDNPRLDVKTNLILLKKLFEDILYTKNKNQRPGFDAGQLHMDPCSGNNNNIFDSSFHGNCGTQRYGIQLLDDTGRLLNTLKGLSDIQFFVKYSEEIVELFEEVYDLYIKLSEEQIEMNEEVYKDMLKYYEKNNTK